MTAAERAARLFLAGRVAGTVLEEVHHRLVVRAAKVRAEARAGAPDAGGEVERVTGIAQGLELAAELIQEAAADPAVAALSIECAESRCPGDQP